MEELILAKTLNKGIENAIPGKQLEKFFGIETRDLGRLVEKERRKGAPIVSKRDSGGGYWIARDKTELNGYFNFKLNEMITTLETYKSMNHGRYKPLDKHAKQILEALIS